MSGGRFALAIHGGAGVKPGRDYSEVEAHLADLIEEGHAALASGKGALDVTEAIVTALEASGLYVAGRGSAPNSAGRIEMDAAIMDGARARAGAVAGVSAVRSPISGARRLLETSQHVLLAGDGADAFCLAQGLDHVGAHEDWYRLPVGVILAETEVDELSHGTVGAVALDRDGRLAAATSTGGLFGKAAGRVGDTPLIGCGTWADKSVAVSCTGLGEYFMLNATAKDIAARMAYGNESAPHAVRHGLDAIAGMGGDGGVIAVTRRGEIVLDFNSPGMKRAWVREGEAARIAID